MNILVEASAGTGKTSYLVQRIVDSIATGEIPAERVAAITFTRKAAAELRQRLLPKLGTLPFLGTIHSFCAQLVRAFPLEAGLAPSFRELSESEELAGLKLALSSCQEELEGDPHSLWTALQVVQHYAEVDFPTLVGLMRVRENYRKQRLAQGRLSFHDLLRKAVELADLEPVRQLYQLLFVDEFQDTDPLQVELLLRLTRERPGSLVLVGDPKQSIYRFRGAEMSCYQALRQGWQGKVEELNLTRRATPELCAWFNRAFGDLFPSLPNPLQAHYRPMTSAREAGATPAVLQLACAQPRHEATQLARAILSRVQQGTHQFEDFLVLSVRNQPLRLFEEVFQQMGIPCEAPLRRAPLSGWAAALLPLLRHLVDPQDKPVLVGVLRGPLFGYSDRELYEHVRLAGTLRPYPRGSGRADIAASLQKLDDWRLVVRWLPPGAALAYLIRETGVRRLATAGELSGMQLAMRASGERGLTLAQAVAELMELGVVELPRRPVEKGVRLLTVHKAKGLEARVVFLAAPQAALSQKVEVVVDASGLGFCSLARPPHWQELCAQEKERAEAEQIRLLYVAATRAQETLVVSRGGPQSPWRPLETYLDEAPELTEGEGAEVHRKRAAARTPDRLVTHPSWRKVRISEGRSLLKPALEAEIPGLDARDWGHLIHSLLERAVSLSQTNLQRWARWNYRDCPTLLRALPRALELVTNVWQSQLGSWIGQAEVKLVEVPFGYRAGNSLRFGTVDLALRRSGDWGLIDYKSDRQTLEVLTRHYAGRLEKYAGSWSAVVQSPPHYCGIFALSEMKLSVDLTPPGEWEP